MADIVSFPARSSSRFKLENADIGLINHLAWISRELQVVQQKILATELDEGQKILATQAIFTTLKGLHQTVSTMQASVTRRMVPNQA